MNLSFYRASRDRKIFNPCNSFMQLEMLVQHAKDYKLSFQLV